MAEKKDKKMMVCGPDLKTATREQKDSFINVLDNHIGFIEDEIKKEL